jgi:hypothetical protein
MTGCCGVFGPVEERTSTHGQRPGEQECMAGIQPDLLETGTQPVSPRPPVVTRSARQDAWMDLVWCGVTRRGIRERPWSAAPLCQVQRWEGYP